MRTYRVYFTDGNQKLFDAPDVGEMLAYIAYRYEKKLSVYDVADIQRIEDVEDDDA